MLLHIKAATSHIQRGDSTGDASAYTDAIYRCNQAFEGGLKECYRALTGKKPSKKSLSDIELHLDSEKTLRSRVIDQIGNYRKDWRNPSTHDYTLDFDQNEALLAVLAIYAVTIALVNQSELELTRAGAGEVERIDTAQPVVDQIAAALQSFSAEGITHGAAIARVAPMYALGALFGHVERALPEVSLAVEPRLESEFAHLRPDLMISSGTSTFVVELKSAGIHNPKSVRRALNQVQTYIGASDAEHGFLLLVETRQDQRSAARERAELLLGSGRGLTIIGPPGTSNAVERASRLP